MNSERIRRQPRSFDSRGFTLLELVIASAVIGIGLLIGATMMTDIAMQKIQVDARAGSEAGVLKAELLLRTYLGQAVNIYGNGASSLDGYAGPQGRIRLFNGNSSQIAPAVSTVAVFLRESGARAGNGSEFRPTGIFFHRPSETKSGVLFIDGGNTPGNLSADYGDLFVDNVVEFETRNFSYHNNDPSRPLLSAEVRIVVRYFTSKSPSRSWCPKADLSASLCPPAPPFRDDEKIFRIYFRNNDLNTASRGGALREYTQGFMYYFGMRSIN